MKRPFRTQARERLHWAAKPVRKRYYRTGWGAGAVEHLPASWKRRFGLDDPAAVRSRRIEIGSGTRPTPGYIHVDVFGTAPHVEHLALAWKLPFPDGFATEIRSIHSLEHVHPRLLDQTLREWLRVLAPGGTVHISVPNTPELSERLLRASHEEKWALMAAILGMANPGDVTRPDQLVWPAQHQVLFDSELLERVLADAGFVSIRDRTEEEDDVHTNGWKHLVPHFSLILEACKAGS